MVEQTILQHPIFARFAFPFLLIFLIVFAILEKTKVLGENKQINALVAFVIGLIFVGFAYPTEVVGNMILFLTVAIVVMFVALILWGFVTGGEAKILTGDKKNWVTWTVGFVIVIVVIIAVLWATGVDVSVLDKLFDQSWSGSFWTNVIFLIVVAVALAVAIKSGKSD